jgi:hypothetical protein
LPFADISVNKPAGCAARKGQRPRLRADPVGTAF